MLRFNDSNLRKILYALQRRMDARVKPGHDAAFVASLWLQFSLRRAFTAINNNVLCAMALAAGACLNCPT
jgi:hypothetical protein